MNQELSHPSFFHRVKETPIDPIFGLQKLFSSDSRKNKCNLTIGVFPGEGGRSPKILSSVLEAEGELLKKAETKNYLPITGSPDYIRETGKLIFGDLYQDNIFGAQTVGGTSALRIAGDFLVAEITDKIAISKPTWPNHRGIMETAGLAVVEYPYWNGSLQYEEMLASFKALPKETAVLLQPMCHNPTGVDLTFAEWEEIAEIFQKKELIPLFDTAYQGLGVDFKSDVEVIRMFVRFGHEMIVTHSYSKSMAMYGERVGAVYVVMKNPIYRERIGNRIAKIIRTQYSNPPIHGALVASSILGDAKSKEHWVKEVKEMREKVDEMRKLFAEKLHKATNTNRFSYILHGHGFFALLGISKEAVQKLRDDFAVYVGNDSRVNLAALNLSNIDFVVEAISKVL